MALSVVLKVVYSEGRYIYMCTDGGLVALDWRVDLCQFSSKIYFHRRLIRRSGNEGRCSPLTQEHSWRRRGPESLGSYSRPNDTFSAGELVKEKNRLTAPSLSFGIEEALFLLGRVAD